MSAAATKSKRAAKAPAPSAPIHINLRAFKKALADIAAGCCTKSSHPVLQCVLIHACRKSETVTLTTCNGETWMTAIVHCQGCPDAKLCLSFNRLRKFIGSFDGETLTILDESPVTWTLKDGFVSFKLLAFPTDEFPAVPKVEADTATMVSSEVMREAFKRVSAATSDDHTRMYLCGIHIEPNTSGDKRGTVVVATDTHRLHWCRIPVEGLPAATISDYVWATAAKVAPKDGFLSLSFDDKRVRILCEGWECVSQLIPGQYPNWERVLPKESTRMWTVAREDFTHGVRTALLLARYNANRVRFEGVGDKVIVRARSEDVGECEIEVPSISKNGSIEIAFNGRYLREALMAVKSEGVTVEFTEPSRPATLKPCNEGDDPYEAACLIMPMALG